VLGVPTSGDFSTGSFTWPTFNQNTTGTAANITATSNSTLTTLSALSLPGSQVTGNISGNAGNVTGTVAIANGGTGQTTANAAFNALAPSQTGNSGKYLTTDGTNTSWSTNAGGDVVGPASSTANGIALFDGTTGKLLKDSASTDGLIYGLTVGRGAGAVATNTAVGASALAANTTGVGNAAFGAASLPANTDGYYNIAIGYQSLQSNTSGYRNTAIGAIALNANNTGTFNTAVGNEALYSNTTASNNTAVGYQAGYTNQTGSEITFLGYQAGYNSTGTNNNFLGYQAGKNVSTGSYNVFIGSRSGSTGATAITGNANTVVGEAAGFSLQGAATYNAFLGFSSGINVTTGTKNTIIGSYSGNQNSVDIRTASNYIVLSDGDGYPAFWGQGGSNGYMRLEAGRLEFPATQNASSNANTLDDYEEGTWTPVFTAQTGTLGSVTYENRSATYTKIGNTVFITCTFYTSAFAAGTGTGDLLIGGLPFTTASGNNGGGLSMSDVRLWTLYNPSGIRVNVSSTTCLLYYRTTANGPINNIQVSDAGTTNPSNVVTFGGFYTVA